MPNHISTILTVSGTPRRVETFMDKAKTTEEDGCITPFSFNAFWPCPPELHDVNHPVSIISNAEYKKQQAEKEKEKNSKSVFWTGKSITEQIQAQYIKKYGYDNWYDWQIANWGTKWDCYDHGEWNVKHDPMDEYSVVAELFYMTAWSPATEALKHISSQFPDLTFKHEFADEGGGFIGYEIIQNGESIEQCDYNWESEEAASLRQKLGMSCSEDES